MYRSTITIYSHFDPSRVELSALAREAEEGAAICTHFDFEPVADTDLPEDAASFFNVEAA
jgi:hypothetical protein